MAARYWVGGTASWDATAGTKWATTSGGAGGAAVPTSTDDVFFDAASGSGTVTVTVANPAQSLNFTGFTGTFAGTSALTLSGSLTLASGMTYTYSGSISFTATATIITAGKSLVNSVTIAATGGTVTLADALTTTGTVTVTSGTFSTGASGYSLTCGQFVASGLGVRAVQLNSSTVTCTVAGNGWNTATTTNLTFTAGTSTIIMTANGATFNGGGLTFNNVSFTFAAYSSLNMSINGANTFNTLTLTAPSTNTNTYLISANQTITTLVCAGGSAIQRLFLASSAFGIQRTLTVGTYSSIADVDFKDIIAAGASSPWVGTRLGDCGNNTNITFPSPKTVYWNSSVGTANWSYTAWATTSGGSPALNNFPLAQDTAVIDNASGGTQINTVSFNVGTIDMSARTGTGLIFNLTNNITLYGNLVTGSAITYTGTATVTCITYGTQTITSAGKTFTGAINITAASAGTTRLSDIFSATGSISLTSGTFDTNNYAVTAGAFVATGSTNRALVAGTSTMTFTGAGTPWSATSAQFSVSGTGIIRLSSASAKTFTGGSVDYGSLVLDQGGAGTLTIAGVNTFGDITNSYAATGATTIALSGNQTVSNFTATGSGANVLTLTSNTTTQRTLTKTSGTVYVNALNISYINATGGAVFYALNSTDSGNNAGWIFSSGSSSNFFALLT